MKKFTLWVRKTYNYLRFGAVTAHIIGTVGGGVPAEIEYRDKDGRVVGFWAYGYWHPDYPYSE